MILDRVWSIITGQSPTAEPFWLRTLFLLNIFFGLLLIWIVRYPPMVDLPQHTGQVSVLHDLLLGISPWESELKIDWITPYLVVYLPAALLSFVIPPLIAVKLILNLAFLGFVGVSLRVIRFFEGAESLRWLALSGYFGFAWNFGFITFLTAAPFGLLFILSTARYAKNPNRSHALRLILFGTALFFCHVLIFLFSALIGGTLLLAQSRLNLRWLLRHALPYLALAALPIGYFIWDVWFNPIPKGGSFIWEATWVRLLLIPFFLSSLQLDYTTGLLECIPFLLPFIMLRLARDQRLMRSVPFLCFLLVWILVPAYALDTAYLFQRFALFALPLFVLLFEEQPVPRRMFSFGVGLLILTNFALIGIQTNRWLGFEKESRDLWEAIAEVPPQQRVLHLVYSADSPAAVNYTVYRQMAAWYQVEHQGWIEYNFAAYRPQLVHYRTPPAGGIPAPIDAEPTFDWKKSKAARYDYFFVRHMKPLPPELFTNDECEVTLFSHVGAWSVFKRRTCKNDVK